MKDRFTLQYGGKNAWVIFDNKKSKYILATEMLNKYEEKLKEVLDIIKENSNIEGGHHKQWIIDQVVRIVVGDSYEEWVAGYEKDGREWDVGVAL